MKTITCLRCSFVGPRVWHYGSRVCQARVFIAGMKARGYVPIPQRRWKRRFKKEGVDVVHGPISDNSTGNWAPRRFVEELIENRRHAGFRKLPFHLQVKSVVLDVMMEELLTQAP
ncbi:hypothetical protein F0U62_08905 [Cystobacter fuscus]|uniref:hypothetical protein n=1 Tax=Cystobacter fuscus TaxID=43 RepID=UPI002B29B225|nr:hypothetical protein F0U62_08905 [Cystobacter fuscus]